MLQPRRIFLLILLHCTLGLTEDAFRDPDDGRGGPNLLDRTKRETPEVTTILLIDNDGGFGKAGKPAGLLTSTARTFVNEGATTEYGTQVVGTTLENGRLYAQILQTTSRVYYGDQKYKPVKNTLDPFIRPTEPVFIFPTKPVGTNLVKPEENIPEEVLKSTGQELFSGQNVLFAPAFAKDDEKELLENVIRARKSDVFSNKRNADGIKPSKVSQSLPTFTVKHDFAPSGFSVSPTEPEKEEKKEDKNKLRLAKGLFVKQTPTKLDTVTYVGFADFTTTVGNTVIVFTPHTKLLSAAVPEPPVTKTAEQKIKTDVKTFMSHSPGMATTTVPGHNINMQTAIPTIVADRKVKAFAGNPEARSSYLAKEQEMFVHPSTAMAIEPSTDVSIEPSESTIYTSKSSQPTEPLATYATTVTRSFNQAGVEKPLGLLKSIGGTKAYNGTTTHFTSLIYGTYAGKSYTQILQTSSNSFYLTESNGKKATVYLESPTTTPEPSTVEEDEEELLTTGDDIPVTEPTTETPPPPAVGGQQLQPTEPVSRLVPSTVYKTFTYLTTFFIPAEGTSTTTSIRSREVVTSDITYVTKVIDDTWLKSEMPVIEPTEVNLIDNTETVDAEFQLPAVRILAPENVPTTTEQTTETETTLTDTTEAATTVTTTKQPSTTSEEPEKMETSSVSTTTTTTTTESTTTEATTEGKVLITTPDTQTEDEEIEVVYKTLFTTYTYLTTFFQESTTSIASREEVVTNIITSTLGSAISESSSVPKLTPTSTVEAIQPSKQPMNEDLQISTLETQFTTYTYFTTLFDEGATSVISRTEVVSTIAPTPTVSALPASILENEDLLKAKFEMLLREQQNLNAPKMTTEPPVTTEEIPMTTEKTEVTSEKPEIKPTSVLKRTKYGTVARKLKRPVKIERTENSLSAPSTPRLDNPGRRVVRKRLRTKPRAEPQPSTVINEREGVTVILLDPSLTQEDKLVKETLVTDVTQSTSKGNRQVKRIAPPEPIEVRGYGSLEDQISSESNNEEIRPSASPTLLLQTSFTTFTYFTTVYKGSTSSDIISRLETVTNVVTETVTSDALLTPSLSPEDATLPITYFTTFTYWTTLYKDGNTVVTSREDTISNVVTPSIEPTATETTTIKPTASAMIETTKIKQPVAPSIFVPAFVPPEPTTLPPEPETTSPISTKPIEDTTEPIIPKEGIDDKIEPTTYFTTYTYFTTSYVGDSTVVKSRLETVTNIINTTTPAVVEVDGNDLQTGRAISPGSGNKIEPTSSASLKTGLLSTLVSTAVKDDKTTLYSTDVFGTYIDGLYAKVLESTTKVLTDATPVSATETQKTGIVSINEGSIIDADGISTTFFTTKAIGTSIEQLYAQVVESTSSVVVDNDKKSALESLQPGGSDIFKTGLVRLIEGSIIKDDTTTLYESRVIGTVIDGRYAQIIESTSSYKIAPTATVNSIVKPTAIVASPSAIQSSIPDDNDNNDESDNGDEEDGEEGEGGEEDEDNEDGKGKGRQKSRLSAPARKKTFTPVIRPFASRNRPTFLPKKKTVGASSAQTVTRPIVTPTITATLATKPEGGVSRNRFSGRRSSSSIAVEIKPTASSTPRRFGAARSRASTTAVVVSPTIPSRGRSSSRVTPTPSLNLSSSRGRNSFRSSSSGTPQASSSARPSLASARPRIRPTLSGLPGRGFSSSTTPQPPPEITPDPLIDEEESDVETEEEQAAVVTTTTTTTEDPNSARRNGNPLLRFRRPPVPRVTTTTTTTNKPDATPRRGLLNQNRNKARITSTTTNAPATTAKRSRPASSFGNRAQLPNRPRPVNNLFPPRGLLKKPAQEEEEKLQSSDEEEEEEEYDESDSSVQETAPKKTETENKVQIRKFDAQKRVSRVRRQTEFGSRSRNSAGSTFTSRYRRPTSRASQAQERDDYYDDEPVYTEAPKTTPRVRGRGRQNIQVTPSSIAPRIRTTPTIASRVQFTIREKDTTTANPRTVNFRRNQVTTPRRRTSSYKATEPTPTRKPTRLRSQPQVPSAQRRGFTNQRRTSTTRGRNRYGEDEISPLQPAFDGTITVTHKKPMEVTIPFVTGKVTEYRNVITAKPSIEVLGPHQYMVTSTNGGTLLFLNSEVTNTLPNGAAEVTRFLVHETPTTSVTFTPTTIRGRKTSYAHIVPSTVYEVENLVTTLQPSLSSPLANILLSQLLLGNLNIPQNAQQTSGTPTPTTEYKTKTTTYVTSVTESQSTVIPLTFRGKEILTTILDSSVNVITATEFITETVVITPTVTPNNQLNSLLLPALLQAQLLNPSAAQPGLPALSQLSLDALRLEDKSKNNALSESEENLEDEKAQQPKFRKNVDVEPTKEVVTLYVSGRRPGEFSTVLSTVVGGDSSVRKREAMLDDIERLLVEASEVKQVRVLASQLPRLDQIQDDIEISPGPPRDGGTVRGLSMSVEPRYNLATKVMSNGVEVIVAGDRSTRPGEPEYLRLISSTVTRPITLAPHTLSHHMSMLLPSGLQSGTDVMKSIRRVEDYKTSTLHTTFIFPTSVVENEKTKTTTTTVVTNVKVVIADKTSTTSDNQVTLSTSPIMETQVHKTVLTYLNTILDDDQPLVATSKHTVTNTLLAPSGAISLEPSETAPETNTYYATQEFTRTVTDGNQSKVVSTTDVVTQVVITDPPATEILSTDPATIDVTKTYFVTYTYFSTYLEDDETKVSSHVSVSTDVAVEQFTMKKTSTPVLSTKSSELAEKLTSVLDESENDVHFEPDDDDDQLTSSSGDIVDEWYEKFKIKPTTETEVTKTKAKTKTSVKSKLKTKAPTKASTESIETTGSYSTSTIVSSTVTSQGTTLFPGDQVIVIYGDNGDTSLIPLSDPTKKKPKNETSNDFMSLSALGINSMNVLGPVFNAMAGILKNHQKDALKIKNDTIPVKKTTNVNPLLSFMSNLAGGEAKGSKTTTTTTPRAPLYIPVGSFARDPDLSESETRISILPKPEKWVQEKWPAHHLDKNRRTHDNTPMPHLEGGIPISPGQVINTNSDVIIGRPSDSGPRPPNYAVKDNVPVDMKPPPLEEHRVHIDPIGQFSTNQGVDPDIKPINDLVMKPPPLPKPGRQPPVMIPKPNRPQAPSRGNIGRPTPPLINSGRPPKQPHQTHDSGAFDLNPPPLPPSLHHPQIVSIPVHLRPDEIVENYVNPIHFQPDNLALPNEVLTSPTAAREIAKVIDRSSGRPLLVNIQPSQVAQVLIPQGSSTALIISEEQPHATRGEVIDDPSPHPEPETVGFIGAEPVLKVDNNEIVHRPVNTMMEVIKGESLHNHPYAQGPEIVNVRPRPDYDNIGMRPPAEPKPPHVQSPQGSNLQIQLQPHHPHQQPQFTLSKKDPSGIYVDISPPGHLPPPIKTHDSNNVPQQMQQPQPENMANHQSGVVHDVPLVAQVQLGSGKPDSAPLNEILLNFDADSQQAQVKDDNLVHRPANNYQTDLSPPPPPPRPSRPANHAPAHPQRFPIPHSKPNYPTMMQPPDFMIPPPKPTFGHPMVIPVGAGAANHRPRPGEILIGQPSDYPGEEDMETEADDPFKTEDGEEIQESNTRPLLPGQVPAEVEKLNQNHSEPSIIGVGQTLSFGISDDKVEENNPPGLREPETIIGLQMPNAPRPSGFSNNNEAVVSVGSQTIPDSAEINMEDTDQMFGMKIPTQEKPNEDENMTRNDNSDGMLKPGKTDEVMGMSPPPLNMPLRPLRPPRPNSPFKFEMPAKPNLPLTPINMENDFPPVRSPEHNKKPFKPEDVFPPRLPENFVYREYEINTRKPIHKRPFVTSMPIDSPTSSTTEPTDVNGHSKPVVGDVVFAPESTPAVILDRPKPVIHERPPNVNMQKPSRPPNRPPTVFENKPPRLPQRPQSPTRRPESDAPKRGQPPFPFERPPISGDSHFGEKVRPPTQQMSPPKVQPPSRQPPTGIEQPLKRPYEQPTRGGEMGSIYDPPPRPPQTRPHKPPQRLPPSGFDHPPPRPTPVLPSKPSPTRKPPARPPPSPTPSEYEQPPPNNQPSVVFEEPPREQNHPVRNQPPKFEPPANRVEPSPHFDNQPALGQSQKEIKTTERPVKPFDQDTDQSITNESKEQIVNPPTRHEESKTEKPIRRPDERPVKPPARLPYRPTSVKPPRIPIPTREEIQPTPVKIIEEETTPIEPSSNIITMVTSGSTTIFGDLYTDPMLLQPTRIITSNQGIEFSVSGFPNYENSSPQKVMVVASTPPISIHTTTLTVTSTMTTVLHSSGQIPITRTVLLTTTLISTIVDKVTETETLVKPTTSTVTQTQTVSTTKTALVVPTAIYPPRPPKYPTAKPEIFVADPHDKGPEIIVADPHDTIAKPEIFVADPRDKDTMTISVSSSMSKKEHKKDNKNQGDNQSILVVVTDKPSTGKKDANILLGGILTPPVSYPHPSSTTECLPECRPSRSELCIKQDGLMKCVCRPGFARMFPDQPCKPTYTYSMQLMLDRMGDDTVSYQQGLHVPGSPKFVKMSHAAKEGLNRMVMQSDLRDLYHGVAINGFQPKKEKTLVDFYVQLSENIDDNKVLGVFKKALRSSNFSLGGTEMFAAREADNVYIQDFNECLNGKFHDCSQHSRCFNLKGTYTCSCKEGFTDISENPLYPGRLCSDMIGCEFCGYHGTCFTRGEQQTCECFQWYTGDRCRINLKVLLIALVTIGAILLALLLVCVVLTCIKRHSSNASRTNGSAGYLRYRGPPQALDKRAMIVDTSSESSVENLPYVTAPPPPPMPQPIMGPPRKPALRQAKRPAPRPQQVDQRDRSLTVMIPRVKYRTGPAVAPITPHVTMSTFSPDKHLNRTAAQMATEQKLLNYLEAGGSREANQPMQRLSKEEKRIYDPKPTMNNMNAKKEPRVFEYEYKTSNMNITDGTSSGERRTKDDRFRRFSDQTPLHHDANSLHHRKYSAGALVSAGYAVSATGGLIQDIEESTGHSNTLKSNRSQFTTLNRSGDHKTMSEARSYDETLIQPQTRPLRTHYSGSSSSRLHPDENHTMVERDLGSTFLLPESHLFKPAGDRGSDISNFDSL